MNKITAVVLAAGAGTRMKSKIPKVLHEVCGRPMVNHVLDAAKEAETEKTIVVVGHGGELVQKNLTVKNLKTVWQHEQLGTGHAVIQAIDEIPNEGYVLLLCGDTPLIKGSTLKNLIEYHHDESYHGTVLTAEFSDPTGYGRVVRDKKDNVLKIVEHKDAKDEEKLIKEINSGMYCFNAKSLKEALINLTNDNAQGEYYITDVIEIFRQNDLKVGAYKVQDNDEILGVNSRKQLAEAQEIFQQRILNELMDSGVTIINPQNTFIDKSVKIGRDTTIYPGAILKGETAIGEDCVIGHNTRIEDSMIGNNVNVQSSTIVESMVQDNCKIGPYAYLRPKTKLCKNVKIGDFVEVKNAVMGEGSKASHLAYIGDAEVGKNVNIGCGVVFVNYDGKNKHKTIVEDNAFIGSNTNLVAPVTVKAYGYVATGSTITSEVPEGALSIARERQVNIPGWVEKRGLLKKD